MKHLYIGYKINFRLCTMATSFEKNTLTDEINEHYSQRGMQSGKECIL